MLCQECREQINGPDTVVHGCITIRIRKADRQTVCLQYRKQGHQLLPGIGNLKVQFVKNIRPDVHNIEFLRLRNTVNSVLIFIWYKCAPGILHLQLVKAFHGTHFGNCTSECQVHCLSSGSEYIYIRPLACQSGLHQSAFHKADIYGNSRLGSKIGIDQPFHHIRLIAAFSHPDCQSHF